MSRRDNNKASSWPIRLRCTSVEFFWCFLFVSSGVALWITGTLASSWGLLAAIYLASEVAFFAYGKFRYEALNQPSESLPDPVRRAAVMQRFSSLADVFGLEEFLSGWFLGAPASTILHGNIEEFVVYGLYAKYPHQLSSKERGAVDAFLEDVQSRWGIRFDPGYNPSLRFMAHVWEPLRVHHKPLAVYAATEMAATTAQLLLRLMGFKRSQLGRFTCWTSPPGVQEAAPPRAVEAAAAAAQRPSSPLSFGVMSSMSGEPTSPAAAAAQHAAEVVHAAAAHALDAALTATSATAAAVSQQYPHAGQLYHLTHPPSGPGPHEAAAPAEAAGGWAPAAGLLESSAAVNADGEGLRLRPRGGRMGSAASSPAKAIPHLDQAALPGGTSGSTAGVPIVFLHGVGFGVLPYLHLIRDLMKACPSSPFIVLEMPHVALRLCRDAATVDEVAAEAVQAVHRVGAQRACYVGHSYGTLCVSRIVQLYPEAVHSVALLDPVCLLTCYPQLLYNFLYRSLSLSVLSSPNAALDAARFLCSRDLTISQAFCRRFHWSELMLWPADLPRSAHSVLVVLSGRDDLVPSELVQAQFRVDGHPARVMYHAKLGHGGLLLDSNWMAEMVAHVGEMVRLRPEGSDGGGGKAGGAGAALGGRKAAK